MTLKVAEIFPSIQGEGGKVGTPTVFIRLQGCNLRCAFCDTKGTWESSGESKEFTPFEILDFVGDFGIRHVTITGGEPLSQKYTGTLILDLLHSGYIVNIETNGTIPLTAYPELKRIPPEKLYFTVSPKTFWNQIVIERIDCLKILYPYLTTGEGEISPRTFNESSRIQYPGVDYILQPVAPDYQSSNEFIAVYAQSCRLASAEVQRLGYPWRMIPQMHKFINIK